MTINEATDFPITSIGNRIYGRSQSGAIATACDDAMAAEIARRLNMTRDLVTIPEYDMSNPDHLKIMMDLAKK